MYFGNLLYVTLIKFRQTCEAPFIPMAVILSSHFHVFFFFFTKFSTGFQVQRTYLVLLYLPNLFLNSLPLVFQSSQVTPPFRILKRFLKSHFLTEVGKTAFLSSQFLLHSAVYGINSKLELALNFLIIHKATF